MNKLTIYIADDHTFVRSGMTRLLNTFERVGSVKEAANGKELIALIEAATPDIVILDIEMPVLNGVDTSQYLSEHHPDVKILVLTMHTEEFFVNKLLEIGVHGFLNKSAEPKEVEDALHSIADRDFYRNEIMNRVLNNKNIRKKNASSSELTPREIEILMLICQDLTSSEICERLKIHEKTFFTHRTNILTKVNVRGNVGLVKYAYQHGLLDLPSTQ